MEEKVRNPKRIGIFGGAFDPPHNGHINLVNQVCSRLGLEEMLIVPTYNSPHKPTPLTPFEDRAEMCRLAFKGTIVKVSDIERRLGGEGYSLDMIRAVKEEYPGKGVKFFFIIGGDMLFYFTNWFRYESVLKECSVVAAARDEDSYADMCEEAARLGHVKVLNLPVTEISSTQIREKLRKGENTDGLIPVEVAEYINKHKLYQKGE
ncbi:MAG: nicotinate (nicotinamide) nucleotide adenylyltransferase [Firmicutes bacterium]|nr:nicotinate (nicotinamide) nucleotide adenylyltransferase [[Eubacterium] siraeum]MCM1488516.1 nicotinate (nicotinamide) nucleotide adenylyltransferase [Bacillota bacterium]